MALVSKLMTFMGFTEEHAASDGNQRNFSVESDMKGRSNLLSLHAQKNMKLVLCEPQTFEHSQEIADNLKNKKPVLVNLQSASREQATKIIDFLSGTIYALNGQIQKVGPNIFVCAPINIDIQGSISEIFKVDVSG